MMGGRPRMRMGRDYRMDIDYARGGRDSRNPYGAEGGYVSSSRRGRRDRASRGMDMEYDSRYDYQSNDMADRQSRDRNYDMGNPRSVGYYGRYGNTPFELRSMEDFEMDSARGRGRDSAMDYARSGRGRDNAMDFARGGSRGGRDNAMDYARGRDYGYGMDYGYDERDYRMDYGYDYGYDYAMGGKLEEKEVEDWTHELLEKVDDKDREMLKKEKILKRAEEMGIKFDKFTKEEFYLTTIMLYTDYCKTFGSANIDTYIRMAKDWLMDDDVKVKHGEKLAAYYDYIVKGE